MLLLILLVLLLLACLFYFSFLLFPLLFIFFLFSRDSHIISISAVEFRYYVVNIILLNLSYKGLRQWR